MTLSAADLGRLVAAHGAVARVVVAEAKGSVPREVGAAMVVWGAQGQHGTIGGGALEWEAAAAARAALAGRGPTGLRAVPLGPALGQCCGGAVTLLTEIWDTARVADLAGVTGAVYARPADGHAPAPLSVSRHLAEIRRGTRGPAARLIDGWFVEPLSVEGHMLWLHGAGHVGRAIAAMMAPLPDWRVTWVDTAPERFPETVPEGTDVLVASDPARAVSHAPATAHHLILTYSHALDLALCDAVLHRGFASAGLIGSKTKWARFRKRLAAAGHPPAAIARIACPIGDPALGKHPQAIALGTVHALLRQAGLPVALEREA